MRKKIIPLTLILFLLAACSNAAQETPTETPTATAGVEDVLAEQQAALEAQKTADAGTTLPPTLIPSDTPTLLSTDVPLTPTNTPSSDDWQEAPIVPASISPRAVEIYLNGLVLGRNPYAFSKVGDCNSTSTWFLGVFDHDTEKGYYRLGDYEYLSEVITYYTGSWGRNSKSTNRGFTSSTIFSPLWADTEECESDEGPVQCEIRIHNPSVALVMLGTNDYLKPDDFEASLRMILDYLIERGILPILSSKADNLEGDHKINRTIYKLALEYEIPFWNYWAAIYPLPNHGLQEDGEHLTVAPNYFDDEYAMTRAWPLRNLTALQTLDVVWRGLSVP
jgi:hypothetical protein